MHCSDLGVVAPEACLLLNSGETSELLAILPHSHAMNSPTGRPRRFLTRPWQ